MLTGNTKRTLDAAVDELKRNGFMVLVIMLDQKSDEAHPMGHGVEVLCSETNDPQLLGAMLKTTLEQLTSQGEGDRRIN